ncbi:hypothetical protein [Ramlibacter sp. PS4R-6]|uniref:hypothetical protein n=1 Tax=Ramlibacter sp. PS4R-6 TaxID=3133438 RepID=UPI00309F247E
MVIGWKVDRAQRDALLTRFSPRYARAIADHVTLAANVAASTPPPKPAACRIVGHADDGAGVEAVVVEIDGTTARPGGGTFHITWSLAEGRQAKESNDVIAARGWQRFDEPVDVTVEPASF